MPSAEKMWLPRRVFLLFLFLHSTRGFRIEHVAAEHEFFALCDLCQALSCVSSNAFFCRLLKSQAPPTARHSEGSTHDYADTHIARSNASVFRESRMLCTSIISAIDHYEQFFGFTCALVHQATTAVCMQQEPSFFRRHAQQLLLGCLPKHLWRTHGRARVGMQRWVTLWSALRQAADIHFK